MRIMRIILPFVGSTIGFILLCIVIALLFSSCSSTDRRFRVRSSYTFLLADGSEAEISHRATIHIECEDKAYKVGDTINISIPPDILAFRHYEVIVDTVR